MTDPAKPDDPREFDAFLDGTLGEHELQAWTERVEGDTELRAEQRQQAEIDKALRRLFPVAEPSAAHLEEVESTARAASAFPSHGGVRIWLAAAALLAAVSLVGWWNFYRDQRSTPHFQPQPLARIFNETVRDGFQPYYECRDDERFAAIFWRRQGQALQLASMPDGTRMLGLSYPGGLSRETTAMLCRVDEEPVMVFVDRLQADWAGASQVDANSPFRVYREERDGLVFYEVSRLDVPRVTEYLSPAENKRRP